MADWVTDRKPEEGEGVIVAVNDHGMIYTHLCATAWDGKEWVDADGFPVEGVIAWTTLPKYGGTHEGFHAED